MEDARGSPSRVERNSLIGLRYIAFSIASLASLLDEHLKYAAKEREQLYEMPAEMMRLPPHREDELSSRRGHKKKRTRVKVVVLTYLRMSTAVGKCPLRHNSSFCESAKYASVRQRALLHTLWSPIMMCACNWWAFRRTTRCAMHTF